MFSIQYEGVLVVGRRLHILKYYSVPVPRLSMPVVDLSVSLLYSVFSIL